MTAITMALHQPQRLAPAPPPAVGHPQRCRCSRSTAVAPHLSRREVEILLAWFRADSKHEAAATLFISASTVNTHLSRIREKYADVGRPASTKTELFARAAQDNLVHVDDW